MSCAPATPLSAQNSSGPLGIFEGQSDVGAVAPPGTLHFDPAAHTYTIASAGANLWSKADAFHFVWKKVSGDLSLTANIEFPDAAGNHSTNRKAVLIFRQSLDPDSVYADAARHGSGLTALQYRRTKGDTTQDIEIAISAPETLRLEKRGDTFTLFVATRDGPLHQVGASTRLVLNGPFYAGLGVCAHNPNAVEKAVFSHVDLKPLSTLNPAANAGQSLYSTLKTIEIGENVRRATVVYTTRGHFEAPNWTRDGKTLLFNQDGRIMQIPVAGGTPEPLDIGPATRCTGSHGLSPDGTSLAISCSMPNAPETRVYTVPFPGGGTPRVVTQHPNSYWHSWSPDGKTIIFTRPSHGSSNIYAIPVAGGEEKALTSGPGISDDPDCSPDGKFIYFNSDRSGNEEIWRMRPDGSNPEQITFDNMVNWTPHISRDGKSMVFQSYPAGTTGHPANRDLALRIMSLDDRKVRTLVDITGGTGTMNVPSWAPDSQHLAFVSYQMLPANDNGSTE